MLDNLRKTAFLSLIVATCYLLCRMMWAAGTLAAMSSLSYPAISAFISFNADSDKQGKLTVITSSKYFFVELTYWKLMIL